MIAASSSWFLRCGLLLPGPHFDAEVVIGLVCAVGTDYNPIRDCLIGILAQYGYTTRVVRISALIPKLAESPLVDSPEIARINSYMDAEYWMPRLRPKRPLGARSYCRY
jgi:hypothetical protein